MLSWPLTGLRRKCIPALPGADSAVHRPHSEERGHQQCVDQNSQRGGHWSVQIFTLYNKKTTRVPVLSHQTTGVKTYHLSAKRKGDGFLTEGGLVNENSDEGGFLFIMNLKI